MGTEAGYSETIQGTMCLCHSRSKLQVDPKLVADQLGHTLDVNQNVYTIPELARRREAVNQLETALQIS